MPKLEIEFEITGVKLRIKGESEDVVARATDVQRRLQGAMQSLSAVGEGAMGAATPQPSPLHLPPAVIGSDGNGGPAAIRTRRAGVRRGGGRSGGEAIELTHDAEKYGFPREDWNTATKAMWLLYIIEKQATRQEASAPVIAETFNKYFRRFKAIRANLVARDLANTQARSGTVANNANESPQTWYLLDSGKKEVEAKIKEATTSAQPAQ
jgi:hypothetical protein